MATTAEIKNGLCIEFNNDIFQFVEFQHVKPGKGNAFVRCRMKGLKSGRMLEHTFPAGHEIITARVVRKPHQFLYKDDMGYNFMDQETFEQISIDGKTIENNDFLKEGDVCEVVIHEETNQILGCELPQHVVLEITYSEDAVAGNTATNAQKPATLETGAKVMVPLFVNQGEKIKVDTRTRSYVERVKQAKS
ncbi:MAG: elongation factor P [Bacteroidetes bacterium]|nr:elongation factor P [Bacteroidota bacterium]